MKTQPLKVAWIRNDEPAGKPAKGHLRCPCGNAPESDFASANGHVYCACGRVYTWNGWLIQSPLDQGTPRGGGHHDF